MLKKESLYKDASRLFYDAVVQVEKTAQAKLRNINSLLFSLLHKFFSSSKE